MSRERRDSSVEVVVYILFMSLLLFLSHIVGHFWCPFLVLVILLNFGKFKNERHKKRLEKFKDFWQYSPNFFGLASLDRKVFHAEFLEKSTRNISRNGLF